MHVKLVTDKIEQFFERHKLPTLIQAHIENLNCPIFTEEIDFIIKNFFPFQKKKSV